MAKKHRGAIVEIEEHRGAFALVFLAVFGLTFGFLYVVGATPDPTNAPSEAPAVSTGQGSEAPAELPATPEQPVRVVAKKINLDVSVSNPASSDIDTLDQALLKGAVRYPTSALLGAEGTVLIFGHSSYLPIVHNQAYKAFDGIQNLKEGDIVSVYSGDTEYRYSVTGVKVADATQDVIEMPQQGKHLTLVTCDSFATKSNRFIVTADFVGAYSTATQGA